MAALLSVVKPTSRHSTTTMAANGTKPTRLDLSPMSLTLFSVTEVRELADLQYLVFVLLPLVQEKQDKNSKLGGDFFPPRPEEALQAQAGAQQGILPPTMVHVIIILAQ